MSIAYAPPYPDSPLESSEEFRVQMTDDGKGFGECQEKAWAYLVENIEKVEANLRRKLFAHHKKSLKQFLEEDLPDFKDMQKQWKKIEGKLDWNDPAAIDHLYELVDIVLLDRGPDEYGYICVDFQSGWDLDHGVGILMHQDQVLAAGGREELACCGDSIVSAVQSIQSYDFDEGDLKL